jgi:uncharacterized protein
MATVNKINEEQMSAKGLQATNLLGRHPLTAYFVLALALTWLIASPMIASAQGWLNWNVPFALHYLTGYGPLLAAFIVTALTEGRSGIRDLVSRMFRWQVGLGWVLISAFSLVGVFAVAVVVTGFLGAPWPDLNLLGQVNYLPNLGIAAWLMWILTSGVGEETGWRGFALPRLQKSHNALSATLILTAFWVLWHVPFFFYLTAYMKLGLIMFPVFALGMLAGAIVLTWLYNSTNGSILMVALFHGALNFVSATRTSEGAITIILNVAIWIWAVLLVVVFKPANLARRVKQTA